MKTIVLSKTPNPQKTAVLAMHGCYSELPLSEQPKWMELDETEAGRRVVEHCLKYGHWGVIEHNSITFSVEGYPHSVMQQLRTHRHLSVAAQSMRYTGKRFLTWYHSFRKNGYDSQPEYEKLCYFRPIGSYQDRFGHSIEWTPDLRTIAVQNSMARTYSIIKDFLITNNMPYEMFRDFIPAGYRQNFTMTGNLRSMLHLLDLRLPKDAQLEIRHCCESIKKELEVWAPEILEYYNKKRAYKNKLAP